MGKAPQPPSSSLHRSAVGVWIVAGDGGNPLSKQARNVYVGDGQTASPSCVNNGSWTAGAILLLLFPENCFQRHRLCTQDGNDFLMTLRGLVSRQQ